ncbi:unnamed protein product [Didymodactylos carnosus]|uniref:Uncharacterized protein n=1 Tax=Didymodactylos carnosus TaxID=1234261 RepID=A0A815BV33_9BILA|nr:unnamed protein product [Didymodactylos carnosus]CAF4061292.1 unnamed protein product [Didymodactylos carnosus]
MHKRSTTSTKSNLRNLNNYGRLALHPSSLPAQLQEMMINKIKNDPSLQQQISDIVKSNDNNISIAAESIVSLFTPVFQTFSDRLTSIEDKVDDLERYNRTWCLRFHGFHEEKNENIVEKITSFTNKQLELKLSPAAIENCHRIGPFKNGHNRPIIVRYFSRSTRQEILRSTYRLKQKNSKIFIVEDLTKKTLALFHSARDSVEPSNRKRIVTRNGHVYCKQVDNSLRRITAQDIVPKHQQQPPITSEIISVTPSTNNIHDSVIMANNCQGSQQQEVSSQD